MLLFINSFIIYGHCVLKGVEILLHEIELRSALSYLGVLMFKVQSLLHSFSYANTLTYVNIIV